VTALGELPGVERVELVQRGAGAAPPGFMPGGFPGGGPGGPPRGGPPSFMPGGPGGTGGPNGPVAARHLRLYCEGDAAGLVSPVVRVLGERGATLADLQLGRPSLEDVFIHLTGRGLRG
jgi:ABC-2 type transport system ATP-binding protein